jgi:hypothetical protein
MVRNVLLVGFVTLASFSLLQCSGGSGSGGTGGGSNGGGSSAGGTATGGSGTGGSHTGGGSGTGGSGTGGSHTGGGSAGGGSAGGGSAGGGSSAGSCDVATNPTCPAGSVCLINQQSGSSAGACMPGCDPAGQDCGTGKKCTYVQVGQAIQRSCVDAGTVADGQPCTNNGMGDNCQAGLFCITSTNTCVQFCNFTSVMCPSGQSCSGLLNAMTEFPTICQPGCSLLTQGCANGAGCLPAQGGGTVCVPVGTADAGATCSTPSSCAVGLACVNTGTNKCLPFCNLDGGAPACATGSTCTAPGSALADNAGFCL